MATHLALTGTDTLTFDTTDALLLDTSRASLQVATRLALRGTDALTFDTTGALPLDTSRASLQEATRLALTGTDAVTFDTTDAQIVRPYSGYTSWLRYRSCFDGDGRTDRASLQVATRLALTGTDALTFDTTGALLLDTDRASLQVATRLALTGTGLCQ